MHVQRTNGITITSRTRVATIQKKNKPFQKTTQNVQFERPHQYQSFINIIIMAGDKSPHGQLLKAYAELKKEKDALVALTELQKKEKEDLAQELEAAKQEVEEEKAKVTEFEARMELKAASAECQIAEVESFSKETLQDALEKNAKLSEAVTDLEYYIEESKKDKENLLQRTAALARRDQLQKASIAQLEEEIESLTKKIGEFEGQFALLATRSAEMSIAHHQAAVDQREEPTHKEMIEQLQADKEDWAVEKQELTDRIGALETKCAKLKDSETIMKDTYIETLSRHKNNWNDEKGRLGQQIEELISEKEGIEQQVQEIAELLEREHLERVGKPFEEDPEEETGIGKEPVGTKPVEVYNQ